MKSLKWAKDKERFSSENSKTLNKVVSVKHGRPALPANLLEKTYSSIIGFPSEMEISSASAGARGWWSIGGWCLISPAHAVQGQSETPKVSAASHLGKNRKQLFGCCVSFTDSNAVSEQTRFEFWLQFFRKRLKQVFQARWGLCEFL